VTACVRIISETVSGLPFDAVRTNGKLRTALEPAPVIVDDPFGGANVISGYGLTRKDGLNQIVISLLLRGNAYLNVAGYDAAGMPNILQVLSPDAVQVDVDRKTGQRLYKVNNLPFPSN